MENAFIYTKPLVYELKGDGDEEELIVKGDISSTDPDLVNDIVSEDCLKSMQQQINDRNIKLDLEHEAFRGNSTEEKELNKTKIPVGRLSEPVILEVKRKDGSIQKTLNIKGVINKHSNNYTKVKGNILGKFLDAFSIAFIPTKIKMIQKDNEDYRVLDDVRLLNVALTGNPVNTSAQMTEIFTKSIESLEDYQKAKTDDPDIQNLLEVKSHSLENINSIKKEDKMANENETEIKSEQPIVEPTTESNDLTEIKAVIEQLRNELSLLKEEMKDKESEIIQKDNKTNSKAIQENVDSQTLGKELKSYAGLSEIY